MVESEQATQEIITTGVVLIGFSVAVVGLGCGGATVASAGAAAALCVVAIPAAAASFYGGATLIYIGVTPWKEHAE